MVIFFILCMLLSMIVTLGLIVESHMTLPLLIISAITIFICVPIVMFFEFRTKNKKVKLKFSGSEILPFEDRNLLKSLAQKSWVWDGEDFELEIPNKFKLNYDGLFFKDKRKWKRLEVDDWELDVFSEFIRNRLPKITTNRTNNLNAIALKIVNKL